MSDRMTPAMTAPQDTRGRALWVRRSCMVVYSQVRANRRAVTKTNNVEVSPHTDYATPVPGHLRLKQCETGLGGRSKGRLICGKRTPGHFCVTPEGVNSDRHPRASKTGR